MAEQPATADGLLTPPVVSKGPSPIFERTFAQAFKEAYDRDQKVEGNASGSAASTKKVRTKQDTCWIKAAEAGKLSLATGHNFVQSQGSQSSSVSASHSPQTRTAARMCATSPGSHRASDASASSTEVQAEAATQDRRAPVRLDTMTTLEEVRSRVASAVGRISSCNGAAGTVAATVKSVASSAPTIHEDSEGDIKQAAPKSSMGSDKMNARLEALEAVLETRLRVLEDREDQCISEISVLERLEASDAQRRADLDMLSKLLTELQDNSTNLRWSSPQVPTKNLLGCSAAEVEEVVQAAVEAARSELFTQLEQITAQSTQRLEAFGRALGEEFAQRAVQKAAEDARAEACAMLTGKMESWLQEVRIGFSQDFANIEERLEASEPSQTSEKLLQLEQQFESLNLTVQRHALMREEEDLLHSKLLDESNGHFQTQIDDLRSELKELVDVKQVELLRVFEKGLDEMGALASKIGGSADSADIELACDSRLPLLEPLAEHTEQEPDAALQHIGDETEDIPSLDESGIRPKTPTKQDNKTTAPEVTNATSHDDETFSRGSNRRLQLLSPPRPASQVRSATGAGHVLHQVGRVRRSSAKVLSPRVQTGFPVPARSLSPVRDAIRVQPAIVQVPCVGRRGSSVSIAAPLTRVVSCGRSTVPVSSSSRNLLLESAPSLRLAASSTNTEVPSAAALAAGLSTRRLSHGSSATVPAAGVANGLPSSPRAQHRHVQPT